MVVFVGVSTGPLRIVLTGGITLGSLFFRALGACVHADPKTSGMLFG